jgi:hypothetical protein
LQSRRQIDADNFVCLNTAHGNCHTTKDAKEKCFHKSRELVCPRVGREFLSFHNLDCAPAKIFVQKKSPRQRQRPGAAGARRVGSKLFDAVAFFDLGLGEARLGLIAHAGFGQVQIIIQLLQIFAQRGDLFAFLMDGANDGFSAVLVIDILSIADSADYDNTALHVKQDALVAHAQAIRGFDVMQMFDVAGQAGFHPFNLADNLRAFAGGQAVKVIQSRRTVFNLIALAVHDLQFVTLRPRKFYQEQTTPAAAARPGASGARPIRIPTGK